jgi:hypothetical protein
MVIWYIFPVLICCTKKNLANLNQTGFTWADDGRAALVLPALDNAVLPDGLDEGADPEVAHQDLVVAGAVQARLFRFDL